MITLSGFHCTSISLLHFFKISVPSLLIKSHRIKECRRIMVEHLFQRFLFFYNRDPLFWISSLFSSIFLIYFFSLKNPIYKFQGENLCRKKKSTWTRIELQFGGKRWKGKKLSFIFIFRKSERKKRVQEEFF